MQEPEPEPEPETESESEPESESELSRFELDTSSPGGAEGPALPGPSEEPTLPEPAFALAPPTPASAFPAAHAPVPALHSPSSAPAPSFSLSRVLLTALVALPLGLVGGMIGARIPGGSRMANTQAAVSPPPAPPPAWTEPQESVPKVETINAILARLAQLADRTEALNTRFEQFEARKPEPPPEFAELRAALGRLDASAGELAPLPAELRKIDERVKSLSTAVQGVKGELAAVRAKAEKLAETATALQARHVDGAVTPAGAEAATTTTTATATAPAADTPSAQMKAGVRLFTRGRFKEALGIFNRLELSTPDDARVWYYAALCLGFATNQWTGGTQQLVEKGLERERAGTPDTSTIDTAFSDLTPALGRDWLAGYRRRVAKSETPPTAAPAAVGPDIPSAANP